MNADKLSNRLQTVANFIESGSRIADIGSDHAYLPVFLAKNKQIEFAIAGEVVKGPHENATNEINEQGVQGVVNSRLGDGLEVVSPEDHIDTIVIAGMGGTLIAQILEAGKEKLQGVTTLVLQPNVGENRVRNWLMIHQYEITKEQILKEDHHIYEVIVAKKTTERITYSEEQLLFGPKLLQILPNQIFREKWEAELARELTAVQQMEHAKKVPQDRIDKLNHKTEMIKKVLKLEN